MIQTITGAVARYINGRPLLAAFMTIGAADLARSATLSALGIAAGGA